jgi:hypothetical protein
LIYVASTFLDTLHLFSHIIFSQQYANIFPYNLFFSVYWSRKSREWCLWICLSWIFNVNVSHPHLMSGLHSVLCVLSSYSSSWRVKLPCLFLVRISLKLWTLETVGMTPRRGIRPSQGRYLHRSTPTQKIRQHASTSMPRVGFEPMVQILGREKLFRALDRAGTVIGYVCSKSHKQHFRFYHSNNIWR